MSSRKTPTLPVAAKLDTTIGPKTSTAEPTPTAGETDRSEMGVNVPTAVEESNKETEKPVDVSTLATSTATIPTAATAITPATTTAIPPTLTTPTTPTPTTPTPTSPTAATFTVTSPTPPTSIAGTSTATTPAPLSSTTTSPGAKDVPKADAKQIGNEPKRITRNSPLLLVSSAVGLAKKEQHRGDAGTESEPANSESEDGAGSVSSAITKRTSQIRGRKSLKECTESTTTVVTKEEPKEGADKKKEESSIEQMADDKQSTEIKDTKDVKESSKEVKDTKDNKEKDTNTNTKNTKEVRELLTLSPASSTTSSSTVSTPTPSSSSTHSNSSTSVAVTTNRLTRKAVAQELAANTRITRNRQASTGRPETPPTTSLRGRRPPNRKLPLPSVETATKRKRSEEDSTALAEPGAKYIKIEVKNDSETTEDELPPPSIHSVSNSESLKIKQELIESDDSNTDSIPVPNTATGNTAYAGRGRWRWPGGRKPQTAVSPSTRATRASKMSSPSPSTSSATATTANEPKRRRTSIASTSSTVTRSSSASLLKSSPATSANPAHDEDSKDSLISSLDYLLSDIKMEKLTPDLVEPEDELDEKMSSSDRAEAQTANGIGEPLTVETEVEPEAANVSSSAALSHVPAVSASVVAANVSATGSEKAASLSPEMVSEGVSEISVQQFYKKPEFLENNLGIEEDPKLGEIVQKVTTEMDTSSKGEKEAMKEIDFATAVEVDQVAAEEKSLNDSFSVKSLKEGELRFEESADEKKSVTNDDDISLSTENLSPLVVDEDEDELLADPESEQGDSLHTHRNVAEEDDLIDDDDVTMEESETISMDNNPSLHDDAQDEREEMDELEELEQDLEEVNNEVDEKTKHDCDNVKAKLKVVETKQSLEMIAKLVMEDDDAEKSFQITKTEDDDSGKQQQEIAKILEKAKIDKDFVAMRTKLIATDDIEVKDIKMMEAKIAVELKRKSSLEDDDVLARIDAELKKIGERLKEKPTFGGGGDDEDDGGDTEIGENKENVATATIMGEDIKPTEATEVEDEKPIKVEQKFIKKQENVKSEDIMEESKPTDEKLTITIDTLKVTPASSTSTSPSKTNHKDDDSTSMKSGQSTDTNSWTTLDLDYDEETLRQKEQHFRNLGLLTHKAAERRRLECIQSSAAAVEASRASQQHHHNTKRNGKAAAGSSAAQQQEYTGTLKTVIKLNRNTSSNAAAAAGTSNNGRKNQAHHAASKESGNGNGVRRQSLKMTFQKGRARGQGNADRAADQHAHGEDAYYTIQNENEGALKSTISSGTEHTNVHTHGRKSYNRSNNTSHSTNTTNSATIDSSHSEGHDTHASVSTKKDEKEEILIPEKASSFKFHPGRLCEDQCFYCSGKFGLYDTPCHVGQIKSVERQQKILANEEKLTVDNCLCDACFRHVDRRANVPSYKKRLSASGHLENASSSSPSSGASGFNSSHGSLVIEVPEDDPQDRKCLVPECANPAAHSLRRKCIRKSVKKFLLNFDMPAGVPSVWLCQAHYDAVIQCSGCVLCKRRLGKNHMYHITSDTDRLEKSLTEMGIPVQLGIGTAVCKLCRYFANLLMKPPESNKSQKAEFVKNYRKRLLQFHNIHDGSNEGSEADEEDHHEVAPAKKSTEHNKSPPKRNKKDASAAKMPPKELPSPTGSTGSSVQCLGETSSSATGAEQQPQQQPQQQQQQQVAADNDVLVDYDVPMISSDSSSSNSASPPAPDTDKQMSKLKAILQSSSNNSNNNNNTPENDAKSLSADISNVLRANPNISMRELFPGEEDLGLQFKAPFGSNTSQRTPEGWTRVQTFLQYDEPTRRLWEELQKPYGNQSSFLRHLILLEKYYRNGDLVLSPHASSNASVYTQTVRQRLTSYDQGHCGGLLSAQPATKEKVVIPTVEINEDDDDEVEESSLTEREMHFEKASRSEILSKQLRTRSMSVDKLTKQLSTNAVTITARPKEPPKSTDPSPQKSLLKEKETPSVNIAPPHLIAASAAAANVLAAANSSINAPIPSSNSRSILKSNLLGINKSIELLPISSSASCSNTTTSSKNSNASGANTVPSTETKQQKILDVANKLLGNQLEAAAAAANSQNKLPPATLLTSPPELVSLHRRSSGAGTATATATASSSGSSTSTVCASGSGNSGAAGTGGHATSSALTASLVNAKRPHLVPKANLSRAVPPNVVILPDTLTPQERLQSKSWRPTLMPVEENQHLLNKNGPLYQTADGRRLPALVQVQSGGKPFLISIFDYNRMCILRREKLLRDQMLKATKNRQDLKQQQQMQKNTAAVNMQNFNKNNSKQQAAHQQLLHLQLMQLQKQQQQQQQQAALKAVAARYQPIAPKPTALGSSPSGSPSTASSSSSVVNSYATAPMMPLLASAITNAAATANTSSAAAAAAASLNNASWLWNNFPDANQLLLNGTQSSKLPQLLPKPPAQMTNAPSAHHSSKHHHQQLMLDNTLMSKIPKSLTVIPQHKLMGSSSSSNSAGHCSGGGGSSHKE